MDLDAQDASVDSELLCSAVNKYYQNDPYIMYITHVKSFKQKAERPQPREKILARGITQLVFSDNLMAKLNLTDCSETNFF